MSPRLSRNANQAVEESFWREVVEEIEVQVAGQTLDYEAYLALPESDRSDDEAAVVDQKLTRNLLRWLGYGERDWTYNRQLRAEGGRRIPDYRVHPEGRLAFVVEDKNTTERFSRAHLDQLRRYVAGTAGYALWTNGREIIGLRIPVQGEAETLVRIQIARRSQRANVELLRQLFGRERYTELPKILERICVGEEEWERTGISAAGARERFIADTRGVLGQLGTAARAEIDRAIAAADLAQAEIDRVEAALAEAIETLLAELRRSPHRAGELEDLEAELRRIVARPLKLDEDLIDRQRPASASAKANEAAWQRWKQSTLTLVVEYRQADLEWAEARRITTAAEVWKSRHQVIETEKTTEDARLQAYAEQVAYTFFLRLLLARILEDRGLLPRLVSDGGLARWRAFLRSQFGHLRSEDSPELLPKALLTILYRNVARCYRHFFSQPVFDWFEPDEFLLARTLDVLAGYDFGQIQEDIIGFTYEAYIDEVARGKKGHFLTRGELVDLILSEAGYQGRGILGRRLLDPAAGSGSFLVQAARRLRREIFASEGIEVDDPSAGDAESRLRAARAYVTYLQRDLVGMEINPFSCYLAELNLYIQALDDVLHVFHATGTLEEVERFQIYNTNSLELPHHVLYETDPSLWVDRAVLDEAWELKEGERERFDFVVGNPPYVNRGIVTDAPSYHDIPFYARVLSGDSNTFLLFMGLAQYYGAPGATLAYVVPVNLLGDGSAMAAREQFKGRDWHVARVVRFYRREVLFPGVLQRVCVFTAERVPQEPEHVTIRGGNTVREVREQEGFEAPFRQLTEAAPDHLNGRWKKAWLCVPGREPYAIWDHLRRRVVTDVERSTHGRIVFQQGDVNKTRTKVFRVEKTPDAGLRLTSGAKLESFGPWTVDVYLDPTIDPEAVGLEGSRLRDAVRERAERIDRVRDLRHSEAVFALKDIVGMEPIRPIRGSLYSRGPGNRFLFDNTLQIGYAASDADNDLVRAVFALLVSAVSCYLLQLFSTNAHVTTNELLRTPIPDLGDGDLKRLAEAGVALQKAGEEVHELLRKFSGLLRLASIRLDGSGLLEGSDLPKTSLDVLIRRGILGRPGHPGWKVARLLRKGELRAESDARLNQVLELVLSREERPFAEVEHEPLVPTMDAVPELLSYEADARRACENAYDDFLRARAELDRRVFALYGLEREDWQRTVIRGVPWAVEGREEAERIERFLFG